MPRPVVLALDIGTSSIRASIYGAHLTFREQTQVRYRWREYHDGRIEIDPFKLERVVSRAIDTVLKDRRDRVDAIGVAAFWHSLLGVDGANRPVTPLLPWSDTRAGDEALRLTDRLDEKRVHQRTGCPIHTSYWPARLSWFARHQPAVYKKVKRWVSFPEWLEERWLGGASVSLSQASGSGLLNQDRGAWDDEMLAACRLEERQVSPIVDLDEPRRLGPRLRERWPALAHARWVPAAGDGALNNVGAGCVTAGRAALMIGTSGAVRLILEPKPRTKVRVPFGLWRYRLDRRRVVVGGALSNGGNVREWMLETIGNDRAVERRAFQLAPASHGLTILPFLTGTRSPDYLAHASGAIAGIRLATRREHLLRAIMESVANRFALVFDLLHGCVPIEEVVAAGGALEKSRGWTQLLADVLGRPITMASAHELTSRGAAAIAFEQLGVLDASKLEPPRGSTLRPDARRHAAYRAAMPRQEALQRIFVDNGLFDALAKDPADAAAKA